VDRRLIPVAIALGSNLGDRVANLTSAVDGLRPYLSNLRVSTWHETAPVGVGPQPLFLNGALTGDTHLSARDLLALLMSIENRLGRERPHPGAARTLDLDLILYGRDVIDEEGLRVPHPRFRERRFVLEPLYEIASDWMDPETGRTVSALLSELEPRAGQREPPDPS
jgi:2-amino-4-hydroxy-6-hydroxymethyldihydropteridine diphosphokinase